MAGKMLGEKIGVNDEIVSKACSIAMKAHKSSSKLYITEKAKSLSSNIIFGFAGSWELSDWFASKPFGEAKINTNLFPSIKNVGSNETASVNEAFLRRFEALLENSSLKNEVEKAATEKKHIVFTGHSSGAPMAIFATLWFLEITDQRHQIAPHCITFGSPLIGDRILSHAIMREHWCKYFTQFIMKHDLVPRISLAPLSSIERELYSILHYFNPNSSNIMNDAIAAATETPKLLLNVMRNASVVTSHAACKFMGCTNLLLENATDFIELSPYRPFGTYVFCTGNGSFVIVENPDAVLQILFYCLQLNSQPEWVDTVQESLQEHLQYEQELNGGSVMSCITQLQHLTDLPLSAEEDMEDCQNSALSTALNNLGLSARARLCVRAAGELELQKARNQKKITNNKSKIIDLLNKLEQYQGICEVRKVGYYDAFKLQKHTEDFNNNIWRLELAGIWDEIVEMLKRNELPDEFEGKKEWIEIGTRYRRLVEPLDIANYYRHLKNEDTGPYMDKGRPSRYRYTQNWREHAEKLKPEAVPESCFWAEVEELRISTCSTYFSEHVQQRIHSLERNITRWTQNELLRKDVFLSESTFVKWWKTLPVQHRSSSCIKHLLHT